jgi:hypothetical protein
LIRSQRRGEPISGKPDVLFHQPVLYGAIDCSLDFLCDLSRGCTEEFIKLVELVTGQRRDHFEVATNVREAKELFMGIVGLIEMLS